MRGWIQFIRENEYDDMLSTRKKIVTNFFRNDGRKVVARKLDKLKSNNVWKKYCKNANVEELQEKSIYLKGKSKLLFYQKYFQRHYPDAKVYLSQDSLQDFQFMGWTFRSLADSRVSRFFKAFLESIFNLLLSQVPLKLIVLNFC